MIHTVLKTVFLIKTSYGTIIYFINLFKICYRKFTIIVSSVVGLHGYLK